MEECKKFDSCSAPICPLDLDYKIRVHLRGDRVCLYLREYAKTVSRADLRGAISEEAYDLVAEAYSHILSRQQPDKFGQLKQAIVRASKTPSMIFGKKAENIK